MPQFERPLLAVTFGRVTVILLTWMKQICAYVAIRRYNLNASFGVTVGVKSVVCVGLVLLCKNTPTVLMAHFSSAAWHLGDGKWQNIFV